jgi:hypothetical protein
MRAPDKHSRGLDKIVAEIADKFSAAEADARDVIECDIRIAIRTLRIFNEQGAPLWGYRRDNLDGFDTLRTRIKGVRKALRQMPKAALALFFALEENGAADRVPSTVVQQQAEARARAGVGMLAAWEARCDQLIAMRPGKHGLAGWREELAAREAWHFLRRNNMEPTNSSSSTSLFRHVARLLYEGMTGEQGVDIEHACREIFKHPPLRADGVAGKAGRIPIVRETALKI